MQSVSNATIRPGRSGSGSGTAPYPLPASPTLTNPDMILPDYDESPLSPDRSHSPLMAWKNAHAADIGFDLSPNAFTAGPIAPTTPIIYGNGTMLSDIGEVTEVESTCGPTRSRSGSTRSDFGTAPSSELPYEAIKQKIKQSRLTHQRHMSVESNSTVTANDRPALFADFDDTVSVDDSNFQGDDEDSVADSYIDDDSTQETVSKAKDSSLNADEARYSTPLSRRAEQILANAKRRLNTMEGNLNRARSSLYSPTLSSLGSHSTPSPPVGRPTTAIGIGSDQGNRKASLGHSRISSESNLPTENKPAVSAQRSSSALGTAGGYRRPAQNLRAADQATGNVSVGAGSQSLYGTSSFANSKISLHGPERVLEPLGEEDVSPEHGSPQLNSERSSGEAFLTPTFGMYSDQSLRRSTSSATMRDLKDQVNDLKGRLSTLRDQARADSLKRRSLQSLRTPSPFTHARVEQWYADTGSHEDGVALNSDVNTLGTTESDASVRQRAGDTTEGETSPPVRDEPQGESTSTLDNENASSATDPVARALDTPTTITEANTDEAEATDDSTKELDDIINELDDIDDMSTEDGYDYAESHDNDESASESGESSYHDSVQVQVSHEDREDAFDYEHFFLHSAMGSMSRRRMRRSGSTDSFSSEDSVETTRAPTTSYPPSISAAKPGQHSRRGSAGSISTLESFATATEGRHTRTSNLHDEYVDDHSGQVITLPERARTHTPETARRKVFSPENGDFGYDPSRSQSSLAPRPQSSAAAFQHRSSASTGTNRSFPLLNKSRASRGVLTPEDSPNHELNQISEALMNETASICDKENQYSDDNATPLRMLQKDDQILIERLVASLGRCVLGLTEAGRASSEGRAYRRKIEMARRVLEGVE